MRSLEGSVMMLLGYRVLPSTDEFLQQENTFADHLQKGTRITNCLKDQTLGSSAWREKNHWTTYKTHMGQ